MGKRAKIELRPRTAPSETPASRAPGGSTRTPGREGKKMLGVYVDEATAKRFAVLGAHEGKTNQALLEEALTDLFAKYGA